MSDNLGVPVKSKQSGKTEIMKPAPAGVSKEAMQAQVKSNEQESVQNPDDTTSPLKVEVHDLASYLQLFYQGKERNLTDKIIDIIKKNVKIDDMQKNALLKEAIQSDANLEKSKNLFLDCTDDRGYKELFNSLREFAKAVVLAHFSVKNMPDKHKLFLDDMPTKQAMLAFWENIQKQQERLQSHECGDDVSELLSDKQVKSLPVTLTNVFYSSALWFYGCGFIDLPELARCFRKTSLSMEGEVSSKAILELLVDTKKKQQQNKIFVHWFFEQQKSLNKELDDLRLTKQKLTDDASRLEASWRKKSEAHLVKIAELEQKLSASKQECEGARIELDDEKKNSYAQGVNLRSEATNMQDSLLSLCTKEMGMLSTCITALDREPPKIVVVKQYLDEMRTRMQKMQDKFLKD